jgi:hypothetical protein
MNEIELAWIGIIILVVLLLLHATDIIIKRWSTWRINRLLRKHVDVIIRSTAQEAGKRAAKDGYEKTKATPGPPPSLGESLACKHCGIKNICGSLDKDQGKTDPDRN